jgi:hypothetical protein
MDLDQAKDIFELLEVRWYGQQEIRRIDSFKAQDEIEAKAKALILAECCQRLDEIEEDLQKVKDGTPLHELDSASGERVDWVEGSVPEVGDVLYGDAVDGGGHAPSDTGAED